jgi:hypothetical protein
MDKRYQKGNHNPYIEEEQTTQWTKEKVQKDKQRSTKHTYKTKDRVTWTQLNTGGELGFSGRVSNSCSTSDVDYIHVRVYRQSINLFHVQTTDNIALREIAIEGSDSPFAAWRMLL